MGKTFGALARVQAVTPNCTSSHDILGCHALAEKNPRKGQLHLKIVLIKQQKSLALLTLESQAGIFLTGSVTK